MNLPPRSFYPRHAFLMRQIGNPPALDEQMAVLVADVLAKRGIPTKDADGSSGGGDFLERILGLVRGTGFSVAIFSQDTRGTALANMMLELGFAAMCGKPLVIVKSKEAPAPSDFTRTDWVEYDPRDEAKFLRKLDQAFDTVEAVAEFEETLLDVALAAKRMDCAVAFERANKAFLLTGEVRFVQAAEKILDRIRAADDLDAIADMERLADEVSAFARLGRKALKN